jgi:hypothetical protein
MKKPVQISKQKTELKRLLFIMQFRRVLPNKYSHLYMNMNIRASIYMHAVIMNLFFSIAKNKHSNNIKKTRKKLFHNNVLKF